VLAIDQGTTGSTAIVLDSDANVAGRGYAEFPQHYPRPGWVEHDPMDILRVSVQVAEQALVEAGLAATELAAVGVTNQRETTVLWDRASGEPVANAIVWQDRRTAAMCTALRERGLAETVKRKTGLVIDAYFSGTKIAWLLDSVEGLRKRAAAGEIAFGTVDSWLTYQLTGGRVHATDVTNASRTMIYNLAEGRWDDELLAELDIPPELLPEVRPSAYRYGDTDPNAFLGAAVPVAGLVGDQQAALFAQGCFSAGQSKNTYGTGSFVLMNTATEPFTEQDRLITTVAVGVEGEPTQYALEGPMFTTGSAVQWLRDGLGIISDAAETEALATSIDGNDDVYFVPALAGLGAPEWDPYARGTLLGLTRGTTKAHVARAVLESIAYSTRDVVAAMEAESGHRLPELRVDGGACANGFLMQFQADILGVPVDVPENIQSTALGSAYLAGLATGFWPDRQELAAKRRTARRYEPTMPDSQRETLHARWRDAVERGLGWARESEK
jgi:glycerol kinase